MATYLGIVNVSYVSGALGVPSLVQGMDGLEDDKSSSGKSQVMEYVVDGTPVVMLDQNRHIISLEDEEWTLNSRYRYNHHYHNHHHHHHHHQHHRHHSRYRYKRV